MNEAADPGKPKPKRANFPLPRRLSEREKGANRSRQLIHQPDEAKESQKDFATFLEKLLIMILTCGGK
ncbi:MAG: hypothetical protein ACYSYV_12565 [Planctomycetota bacterium]